MRWRMCLLLGCGFAYQVQVDQGWMSRRMGQLGHHIQRTIHERRNLDRNPSSMPHVEEWSGQHIVILRCLDRMQFRLHLRQWRQQRGQGELHLRTHWFQNRLSCFPRRKRTHQSWQSCFQRKQLRHILQKLEPQPPQRRQGWPKWSINIYRVVNIESPKYKKIKTYKSVHFSKWRRGSFRINLLFAGEELV